MNILEKWRLILWVFFKGVLFAFGGWFVFWGTDCKIYPCLLYLFILHFVNQWKLKATACSVQFSPARLELEDSSTALSPGSSQDIKPGTITSIEVYTFVLVLVTLTSFQYHMGTRKVKYHGIFSVNVRCYPVKFKLCLGVADVNSITHTHIAFLDFGVYLKEIIGMFSDWAKTLTLAFPWRLFKWDFSKLCIIITPMELYSYQCLWPWLKRLLLCIHRSCGNQV